LPGADKIEEEKKFDGIFVLRTDTDLNPLEAMLCYKQLWTVEQTFRTDKHLFSTRPIFHKLDETIRGHVCSFLALVLKTALEERIAALGRSGGSWPEIIDLDIDFDFAAIGFDTAEVDFILEREDEIDNGADLRSVRDLPSIAKIGDLWQLSDHWLFCSSALEKLSYDKLLGGDRAQMVFTDPPYNVPINGHAGGRGAVRHRDFPMASGEMMPQQFEAFLATTASRIEEVACDGAICRHPRECRLGVD
jgi:hypothetical protein